MLAPLSGVSRDGRVMMPVPLACVVPGPRPLAGREETSSRPATSSVLAASSAGTVRAAP